MRGAGRTSGSRRRAPALPGHRLSVGLLVWLVPTLGLAAGGTVSAQASTAKPLATAASCPGVSVYPSPGTRTASRTTQISFRNIAPATIASGGVKVTGSKSGAHSGRWVADSDQHGASFYPTVQFASGETVTVKAATGRRICGTDGTSFSFKVAVPAGRLAEASPTAAAPTPAFDQPTTTYASMPTVKVPKLKVTLPSTLGGGYIFESPQGGTTLGGPMIVNGKGQLVWFEPLPPEVVAADFRVQTYLGKPALTFWEGRIISGHGIGEDVIMNSSYQVIKTIRPGNGYSADLHEFLLSSSGRTAWVTAFNTTGWDVTSEGGPKNGAVLDGIVQELDVATGNVLFEWHSLDHVPLGLSSQAYDDTAEYDYFHVNGIDPVGSGLVLVSSRNTSTIYAIKQTTGAVLWRLGGKKSSFEMGSGARFALEHNPVMHGKGTISLFDDEDAGSSKAPARGIVLRLNFATRRATLERAYTHKGLIVPAQGNVQVLGSGDVVIGWGSGNYTSVYSKSGQLLFDAYFGSSITSYRAYLYHWVGTPITAPALVASTDAAGNLTAYVSWNGATQVRSWVLLGGPNASDLSQIATATKDGFQTSFHLSTSPAVVQVEALGARGNTLGISAVLSPGTA